MLPVETAYEAVGIGQQAEEPVVEDTDHETTMQAEEPDVYKRQLLSLTSPECH